MVDMRHFAGFSISNENFFLQYPDLTWLHPALDMPSDPETNLVWIVNVCKRTDPDDFCLFSA